MENTPAKRVKQLMQDLGYKKVLPFAKDAKLSHTSLQNIFEKNAPVTIATATKLEEAFNANPNWILYNNGNPYKDSEKQIKTSTTETSKESLEFAEETVLRLEKHFKEENDYLKQQIEYLKLESKEKSETIKALLAKWSADSFNPAFFGEKTSNFSWNKIGESAYRSVLMD